MPPITIHITEVGPRDGLQNESTPIAAADKVAFINLLSETGLPEIEATSFVKPGAIPQLADAAEVIAAIDRHPAVTYSALVPNQRGLDRALEHNLDKIAVFTAASETFAQKNTNASIAATLDRFTPVIAAARDHNIAIRAYISCVVACPYEGPIAATQVAAVARRLLDLGVDELDLGETIGVAVPHHIHRLYDALDGILTPADTVLHLHDTRGTALACAAAAIDRGVRKFDASCIGLGGCPYAPGAAGNLATEDLVYFCHQSGYETNVDLDALFAAGRHIAAVLGRIPTARVFTADGAASCDPDSA